MDRFSYASSISKYTYVKYDFTTGIGFHIPSPFLYALQAKLLTLIQNTNFEEALFGSRQSLSDHTPDTYVEQYVDVKSVVKHTLMNLEQNKLSVIQNITISIQMFSNPFIYSSLILDIPAHIKRDKFHRSTFQQFLMIDYIMCLIARSGLTEYRNSTLMMVRNHIGLDYYTHTKMKYLEQRLSVRVTGVNIGRRYGKSTSIFSNIACSLVFFPYARLKILYAIHKKDGADLCLNFVVKVLPGLISYYNNVQYAAFQKRKTARHNDGQYTESQKLVQNKNDFYFVASHTYSLKYATVTVNFIKKTQNERKVEGTFFSENTLRCRPYVKRNVSIIILILLLLSSYTSY